MKVILIGSSNQVLNNHRKNQIDSFEDVDSIDIDNLIDFQFVEFLMKTKRTIE